MTQTTAPPTITPEGFSAFLSSRDDPQWLTDIRNAAWECFLRLPMPSRADEEWMRTDIRLFRLDRYPLPLGDVPHGEPTSAVLSEGVQLAGHTVCADSRPRAARLDERWSRKGVLFGSLDTMVREHGTLLRPYLESPAIDTARDKFAALNAACWSGGTLLYVPRGVVLDEPLHLLSLLSDGGIDFGRTLVILAEDAEATVLDEKQSTDGHGSGLHCGSLELHVGPQARLRYVGLQHWSDKVWHFAHQKAVVERQGAVQWTIGALGSRLAKVNQHVVLAGDYADAQVNGVLFTEGRQHLSYHTLQHHQRPSCRSDLLYKAALQDASRTVWRGMIKVDPAAQQTDGYQRNDNLMLSHESRADSIPGLEIEADDVRCTHGSTTGRIDDQQVFYCRSRGLTRNEAVRLVVTGFFQQVFDRITIQSVRDALGQAIRRRIRQYD